jgi:hypothetical protein
MFLNFVNNNNVTVLFKPKFKKKFDILKAPYRFKMSKHQLFFSRFNILITFFFKSNLNITNNKNLIFFYKSVAKFFNNFEVNLCLQHSLKIFLNFKYSSNFLLN